MSATTVATGRGSGETYSSTLYSWDEAYSSTHGTGWQHRSGLRKPSILEVHSERQDEDAKLPRTTLTHTSSAILVVPKGEIPTGGCKMQSRAVANELQMPGAQIRGQVSS